MSTASPDLAPKGLSSRDAAACRALMRHGSKTFFAASLLLPARVRGPARALYAFCRVADDLIDLGECPFTAMQQLHARLDAVYAGRPQPIECDRALASVVHGFHIPRELLDALLDGFLWDANGRLYESIEEVQAYGARVAGTVGAMMTLVMGTRCEHALARACDLGVAMQLTNIARDVGEDARNGRLYLPRQWLREAGIEPQQWLAAPRFDAAIASVVQRLLKTADALYESAEHGIAALPRDCRPAIHAARLVYAEIGRELERNGLDSIGRRAVVSRQRKLALIARATGAAVVSPRRGRERHPALPEVQFLVDAAAVSAPAPRPARSFDDRVGWVIQLCERQALQHGSSR
jgi:15-cis-phytoene synthase